jgi:alkylresorcinol/alkylpyrone synthase
VNNHPRIVSVATAFPSHQYRQSQVLDVVLSRVLGEDWQAQPALRKQADEIKRVFLAAGVEQRQSVVDLDEFYTHARSTGERMAAYADLARDVGRAALRDCLAAAGDLPAGVALTDLIVVSCTGYSAPGLDIQLARDLRLSPALRRVCIGHMGCYGAMVALRQAHDAVRARLGSTVAILSVELCSLHFMPVNDPQVLTSFALFGDAAAALLLSDDPHADGPEVIDTYCVADFAASEQMAWTITDQGFVMTLSPRIPITLRRNVAEAVERLLAPQGLAVPDVAHWLVHPGGPNILEVVQARLELSDAQMATSWQVLRDHGNCSSTTVLLILDELMKSGRAQPGEWGVMMAFGPGLTLELCLLRF